MTSPHIEAIARAMCVRRGFNPDERRIPSLMGAASTVAAWELNIPDATLAFTMSAEIFAKVADDFEGGSYLERADDPCAAVSSAIADDIRALIQKDVG